MASVLGLLLVGLVFFWHPEKAPALNPAVNRPTGGEFTLQSAQGPLALKDFRGKVVLLYFGYTYCPDICPTSLAATAQGLQLLKPEELARVAVIFISVDPERDTPARLQEYARFFHPNVFGVTGAPAELAELAKRYGAFYARQPVETAGAGYVIDHTADTYLISPSGQLQGKIPHAAPPEQVAAAIRQQFQ
jgi:protein SCO1/2